ncbi:MAG: DUF1343 domain-containing protein [Saprospiraceae bacterium]|nr:DUF1343 domain-containing protein [Saprospiraceae bacterium]
MNVRTGLDRLAGRETRIKGRVAYLCHNASIDSRCREGLAVVQELFGPRLAAVFSPQHGLFSDAQDNMIESDHFVHPHFKIPVFSLYSETRAPTDEMLDGIEHVIVDLQDAGCRAYTFMYTMTLMMEACGRRDIEVIVLDRPNPIGGIEVEGAVLDMDFASFIGRHPMPMRHGMTIGEIARMANEHWGISCPLKVVEMEGWQRAMYFGETGLPWAFPSPNMPHLDTALVFPGTVVLEGTNLSEGRGSTRPFELFGHPALRPHACFSQITDVFKDVPLEGFALRPLYFQPTFDKHAGHTCGGFQLHVTDRQRFKPWHTGQFLLRALYEVMRSDFEWRQPPFEYEETILPIDILNGTDRLRRWVTQSGDWPSLIAIEAEGMNDFMAQRESVLLYA